MAVSRVSARDPDSVSTMAKGCKKKLGVHPTSARHTDSSNVWRIFQAANAGEVCCAIRTPVAKESNYFGLPVAVSDICHSLNL